MPRNKTMSRFAEPVDPTVVSKCKQCDEELYEGAEVREYLGKYFCDESCTCSYLMSESIVASVTLEKGCNL
jgi:hypothetical protein